MNIQQSYREAAVQGARPVELVVRLYEQMIEDLRQVMQAVENNDIRRRTERMKHVILIVGHLQSTLDFDLGGKVARDLENFYNALRQSVLSVQAYPSKRGVVQLITDLLAVREAWITVDRAEMPAAVSASAIGPPRVPESEFDLHTGRMDWNG